jgi:hypothetical protein
MMEYIREESTGTGAVRIHDEDALEPVPGSEVTGSGGSGPFERALLRSALIKVYAL